MLRVSESQQFAQIIYDDNNLDFVYINNQEGTFFIIKKNEHPELYDFFYNIFCDRFYINEFNEQVRNHYKEIKTFKEFQSSSDVRWTDEEWEKFVKYRKTLERRPY